MCKDSEFQNEKPKVLGLASFLGLVECVALHDVSLFSNPFETKFNVCD